MDLAEASAESGSCGHRWERKRTKGTQNRPEVWSLGKDRVRRPCARETRTRQGRTYRGEDGTSRHRRDRLQAGGAWRRLWAPVALCLHAAPAAHQSGHAHTHPDRFREGPRSLAPPLSCERRGAPPSSRPSWLCLLTRRCDGGTWALRPTESETGVSECIHDSFREPTLSRGNMFPDCYLRYSYYS